MRTTTVKAALLLLAVLSTAGCGTLRSRTASPALAEPPDPPVVIDLKPDGLDEQFRNRVNPPVIPVVENQKGELEGKLILRGQRGYDFDVTYVTYIPTSKMKQHVDNPNADEASIRRRFAEEHESKLGLSELNCNVTPRCEATLSLESPDKAEAADERKLDAFLILLDEQKSTSLHVLYRAHKEGEEITDGINSSGKNDWKPRRFDNRFTGYLKVRPEKKALLPDLVVPLDSTGIASWRYLNPRNPARIFEELPLNLADTSIQPSAKQEELENLDVVSTDNSEQVKIKIQRVAGIMSNLPAGEDGVFESIIDNLTRKVIAAKDSGRLAEIAPYAASIARQIRAIASEVPIDGIKLNALRYVDTILAAMPPRLEGNPTLLRIDREEKEKEQKERGEKLDLEDCTCSESKNPVCACSSNQPPSDESPCREIQPGPVGTPRPQAFALAARALESMRSLVATPIPSPELGNEVNKIECVTLDAFEQLAALGKAPSEDRSSTLVLESAASFISQSALQNLASLTAGRETIEEKREPFLQQRRIRFDNVTADRLFIVTLSLEKCPAPDPNENEDAPKVIRFDQKASGCTGTISVSPESFVDIDASIVDLAPRKILQFTVDFFDQTDDPANSTGYISLTKIDPKDPKSEPEDSHQFGIVAGLTGKSEPFIRKDQRVFFRGRQQDHLQGFARLEGSFLYGNRANAKLNLSYKNGDLGGPTETADKIDASQYQINTYGTNALILTFGKFQFAGPSEKIAVSESGQGFRLGYKALSLSYILNRESAENIPNPRDEDKDSWILQLRPIPINWGILRSANLTAVRGQERLNRPKQGEKPAIFPYVYETYGFDLFFTEPLSARERNRDFALAGSLAGYYSERDSKVAPGELADGRGYVALGTVSVPFNFITDDSDKLLLKKKPRYVATFLAGYGSGDDPGTTTDEGYIGETGGFSRDMIFLTSFSAASTRIRKSLSNKQYAALQITDNTTSVQSWIAKVMNINERDIVSESTTLRLSDYRFNEPIRGDRDAGQEINLEFLMEAPKSVKWTISAAYFKPGRALDRFVRDDAWSVGMGVSINPSINVFR